MSLTALLKDKLRPSLWSFNSQCFRIRLRKDRYQTTACYFQFLELILVAFYLVYSTFNLLQTDQGQINRSTNQGTSPQYLNAKWSCKSGQNIETAEIEKLVVQFTWIQCTGLWIIVKLFTLTSSRTAPELPGAMGSLRFLSPPTPLPNSKPWESI